MGTITHIKKWDLASNSWREVHSEEDKKRALSIVTYDDTINNNSIWFNCIVIVDGYRVENLTKNPNRISNRAGRIGEAIKYFERQRENYKIELILLDNDAPLSEQSKFLASHIDSLADEITARTINYLGFSKGGVMGVDMVKYFRNPRSFIKSRIYSISSPYLGTLIASPRLVEIEITRMIEAKLGKNAFSKRVIENAKDLYYRYFSNSHMDLDIAIPGGVPIDLMRFYDPTFLENVFSLETLKKLQNVNYYSNICTLITDETREEAKRKGDLLTLALCIINDCLYDGKGDGIVELNSAKCIEKHFGTKSIIIPSTHDSFSKTSSRTMILSEVQKHLRR